MIRCEPETPLGMTRAMEHLNVFYKERDDRLIAALAAARE